MKGEGGCAPEMYARISGSDDLYGGRGPSASINFITCHDGFTMYDLVSYNDKHNEANGEDNRDGANDNASWNCGVEGETTDSEVNDLRIRQIRNFNTLLLLSRGIPMLLSGDEFANTQYGNNNASCQDNEVSWLDWGRLNQNGDIHDYVADLIALRMAHPVIRAGRFDAGENGTGYPELSFHGLKPWELIRSEPTLTFAFMYAEDHEKYGTKEDAFIYVAVNAHWEEHTFELPIVPNGMKWHPAAYSYERAYAPGSEKAAKDQHAVTLGPRSTAVLIARR